jgi:hypothetical protein
VVADPEAFEKINEKTLVYAIHCYAEIYEKVARQGGGKIIVCTDVEEFGGRSSYVSSATLKLGVLKANHLAELSQNLVSKSYKSW